MILASEIPQNDRLSYIWIKIALYKVTCENCLTAFWHFFVHSQRSNCQLFKLWKGLEQVAEYSSTSFLLFGGCIGHKSCHLILSLLRNEGITCIQAGSLKFAAVGLGFEPRT